MIKNLWCRLIYPHVLNEHPNGRYRFVCVECLRWRWF
jgi:hypothetical protein